MDANDARTLDSGALELELQPIGYYQVLSEEHEHHLVSPSLMLYLGLAPGLDFIFLSRGFFLTDDLPEMSYRTWESTVAFRFLLLPGRYSTEGGEGPSIVTQVGVMIPNLNGVGEYPGAQVGLLLAQQWDAGTLHANAWLTYTTWRSTDVFLAAAMEGPPDWDVRPLVEVWFDYDTTYGGLLSGLVGLYLDATEHLTFEVGARIAAWEEYSELEVRASMWIELPGPVVGGSRGGRRGRGGRGGAGDGELLLPSVPSLQVVSAGPMKRLHGAHGATYFLDDSALDRPLLVKVLDAREPDAALLLELENELRVTRELEIPGVRRAIRRGEVEGRPALWSTFFAGDTVAQTFVAARQPLERVLPIALRIAEVVGALHAARVVHGHLSPEAIRVDSAFREIELAEPRAREPRPDRAHRGRGVVRGRRARCVRVPRADRADEPTGRLADRPLLARRDPPRDAHGARALRRERHARAGAPSRRGAPSGPARARAGGPRDRLCDRAEAPLEGRRGSISVRRGAAHRSRAAVLERWRGSGTIAPFPLARGDSATRFQLPRKIYGRDGRARDVARRAPSAPAVGRAGFVLVAGPAGIGKTALVHEVHRPLAARRGRFIEGKFDQYHQQLPFSAFTHAFEQWVHLVLSESDAELARQRDAHPRGGRRARRADDAARARSELVIGPQPARAGVQPRARR